MPNNPDKRRCAYPGCRAWARRDTQAPYCAAHFHLAPAPDPDHPDAAFHHAGAPPGNQNRLLHGFYRRTLHDEAEAEADLDHGAQATDLDAEILIARLALRRTLTMVHNGTTLGDHPQALSSEEIIRLVSLVFQGVRTIARLLSIKQRLDPRDSLFVNSINAALDELSAEWGIEL
jgi:hypothetical protein